MNFKDAPPSFRSIDLFAVGVSNREAYEQVCAVFSGKEITHNPIVIVGATGTGKTHLVTGMANSLSVGRVAYLCTADLVAEILGILTGNESLDAIQHYFAQRFSQYDTVVLDDLHVLIGKPATRKEILNVLEICIACQKQVVLITDTPLEKYGSMAEMMQGMFDSMLVCTIEKPDEELKKNIICAYTKREGLFLDAQTTQWLSEQADTVPCIISSIKKIAGRAERGTKVPLSVVKDVVKE